MSYDQNRDAPVDGAASEPVDVRTDGVRVEETLPDVGIEEAHHRFGGIDVPATLVGMLAALALTAILAGLIGAALGAIGYQRGLDNVAREISVAGLIGGIVTLFIAFLVGGWAAARIARYDGRRNGVMTAIWAILLAAALSALAAAAGDEYDVFRNLDVPQFFSQDALTTGAIVSGVVAALAMLLGGFLGGDWGERFHRRADAAIAATREGGIRRNLELDRR
jgi:MFS family permease